MWFGEKKEAEIGNWKLRVRGEKIAGDKDKVREREREREREKGGKRKLRDNVKSKEWEDFGQWE